MNLEKPSQSHMTQCHTVSHVKVSRYGQSSQRTALTCIHFSCQDFVRHQPPKHHSSNSNYRVTVVSCANHTVQTLVLALQATNHYVVRREWSQSTERSRKIQEGNKLLAVFQTLVLCVSEAQLHSSSFCTYIIFPWFPSLPNLVWAEFLSSTIKSPE